MRWPEFADSEVQLLAVCFSLDRGNFSLDILVVDRHFGSSLVSDCRPCVRFYFYSEGEGVFL